MWLWPERLELPLRWRRPRRIFVNSMSDLFLAEIPEWYLARVWATMQRAHWHTFQVLTKRPERMSRLLRGLGLQDPPLGNVWVGTSIENRRFVHRADHLRRTPAAVRFISAEPLLGPLDNLDLTGVDWLIAGGESGARHRRLELDWVRGLRDRCHAEEVACGRHSSAHPESPDVDHIGDGRHEHGHSNNDRQQPTRASAHDLAGPAPAGC